jgi:hypothetical protein
MVAIEEIVSFLFSLDESEAPRRRSYAKASASESIAEDLVEGDQSDIRRVRGERGLVFPSNRTRLGHAPVVSRTLAQMAFTTWGQSIRTTALNLVIPSRCDQETIHRIASEIRTRPWEKNFRLLHQR